VFERSKEFGGGLFALSASVVADLIHHNPLVYRTLDEAGLPQVGSELSCWRWWWRVVWGLGGVAVGRAGTAARWMRRACPRWVCG
jgi:hypothetical protein